MDAIFEGIRVHTRHRSIISTQNRELTTAHPNPRNVDGTGEGKIWSVFCVLCSVNLIAHVQVSSHTGCSHSNDEDFFVRRRNARLRSSLGKTVSSFYCFLYFSSCVRISACTLIYMYTRRTEFTRQYTRTHTYTYMHKRTKQAPFAPSLRASGRQQSTPCSSVYMECAGARVDRRLALSRHLVPALAALLPAAKVCARLCASVSGGFV